MRSADTCTAREQQAEPRQISLRQSIGAIAPEHWADLCPSDDPFASHTFLRILEESGSVCSNTGWQPVHLALENDSRPSGVVPAYLKSHSYGEYVFDHGWAHALERAGGRYYPKLQVAIPFTPVPGHRLLAREPDDRRHLAQGVRAATEHLGISSAHVTFCTDEEAALLEEEGFLRRRGLQYHWHNRGYGSFDDFLAGLKSAKRKMIKKERREVAEAGIELEALTGPQITSEVLDAFYPFYHATVDKRWGNAYLTRAFFRRLGAEMADRIVLVTARKGGRLIAAALNLRSGNALYGRLWGCLDEYRFLHFEACYYQAIEFAICHGLARVEAGAQGLHKVARGYEPMVTHSAHYIREPALRQPVARFVDEEWRGLQLQIEEIRGMLPFSRAANG